KNRPSQVRVAIRARTLAPTELASAPTSTLSQLNPTGYNLGVAVGWKRVAVGAERTSGNPLPALRRGDNVSLDAGASYSLSRRIAVTGGVRYNIERDRLPALQDQRRDSQAVYVGTAFRF